jgi:hypothetical protein
MNCNLNFIDLFDLEHQKIILEPEYADIFNIDVCVNKNILVLAGTRYLRNEDGERVEVSTPNAQYKFKFKLTWDINGPHLEILDIAIRSNEDLGVEDTVSYALAGPRESLLESLFDSRQSVFDELPSDLSYEKLIQRLERLVEENDAAGIPLSKTYRQAVILVHGAVHGVCNDKLHTLRSIYDGVVLAVEQVQDKRIEWLEKPQIDTDEAVIEILLCAVFGSTRLAGAATKVLTSVTKFAFKHAARAEYVIKSTSPHLLLQEIKALRAAPDTNFRQVLGTVGTVYANYKSKQLSIEDMRKWVQFRKIALDLSEKEIMEILKNSKKYSKLVKKAWGRPASAGDTIAVSLLARAQEALRAEEALYIKIKSTADNLALRVALGTDDAPLVLKCLLKQYFDIAPDHFNGKALDEPREAIKHYVALHFEHIIWLYILSPQFKLEEQEPYVGKYIYHLESRTIIKDAPRDQILNYFRKRFVGKGKIYEEDDLQPGGDNLLLYEAMKERLEELNNASKNNSDPITVIRVNFRKELPDGESNTENNP